MSGLILSLCDRTGVMVQPWLEAGYRAVTVDLQPEINPHPNRLHIMRDVRAFVWGGERDNPFLDSREHTWSVVKPSIVFAFPPCTHLAVSGARWFKSKGLSKLIEALQVVESCRAVCEHNGQPWMIENPVGRLSTLWRTPDHYFHPWQYTAHEPADNYTKKTCIWSGGGFVMPQEATAPELLGVEPDDRIHKAPPSEDRGDIRSVTPLGFARAVFAANHQALRAAA
jgi:hypothetical protein